MMKSPRAHPRSAESSFYHLRFHVFDRQMHAWFERGLFGGNVFHAHMLDVTTR